jgi:hypothetical protein
MDADPQLWVERTSTVVTSGSDLTVAHAEEYLASGLIHVVSQRGCFPGCELLLPELSKAVNLQIEFRNALEQLKKLVEVKFDPAAWIRTTCTIVEGGMDLTMADVDEYLTDCS